MGLFDGFPFTNMHQLNLDWILSKIGKIDKDVESAKNSATSAKTDADRVASVVATVEGLEQSARESADRAAETLENATPKGLYQHFLTVNINKNTGSAREQLINIYNSMPDKSANFANVNVSGTYAENNLDFSDLPGGIWSVEICKASELYGYCFARKYPGFKVGENVAPIAEYYLYLYDGVWCSTWLSSPTAVKPVRLLTFENATTNDFAGQEIEVPSGQKFDTLIVEFRHSKTFGIKFRLALKGNIAGCVYYPKSKYGDNNCDETYRYVQRYSGYKVSFQNGYRSGNIDNSAAVPVAIYGLNYAD